jgi:hypothetical protein
MPWIVRTLSASADATRATARLRVASGSVKLTVTTSPLLGSTVESPPVTTLGATPVCLETSSAT